MPERILPTLLKILGLCLLVGLLLAFFDITPQRLVQDFWNTVRDIWGTAWTFVEWAWRYVALGAVVVLPIWLLTLVLRRIRR